MPGARTPFRVKLTDGREIDGVVLPADLVGIERKLGGFGEKNKIEGAIRAAFGALRRAGAVDHDDFDRFLEQLEDYEEEPEGEANGAAPGGATVSPPLPTTPA